MPARVASVRRSVAVTHRHERAKLLVIATRLGRGMQCAFCTLTFVIVGAVQAASWPHDTPVTPDATPETQSLLAFLADNYGQRVIAGQQEGRIPGSGESFEFKYVLATTGKLPALRSFDLLHLTMMESPMAELEATGRARWWYGQSNGLVSFCWHWPAPDGSGKFYSTETSFDLKQALVPGTKENTALLRDLDVAASQLAILRDANVPVLWRPLHEMNGRWFWWGDHGPEACRNLWRLMYDRFTNKHKLNNLLWVFSPGASTDLIEWYPGDAYVDLIGYDHYTMEPSLSPAKNVFDELNALVGNHKMLAMSENGQLPDLDRVFSEKAVWSYFTTWAGDLVRKTPTNQFAAIYNDERVLTADELPDLKKYPFRKPGAPAKLAIHNPAQMPVDGSSPRPIAVLVQDAGGMTVRENGRKVTLSVGDKEFSARTINGIATFDAVKLDKPSTALTLTASSEGLASATGGPMEIGPGNGLMREWWTNLVSRSITDLRKMNSVTKPDGRVRLTDEFRVSQQTVTNYGTHIQGWLIAPATGQYEFNLIAGGSAQFWIETDGTGERQLVVETTPHTPYSKWPHSHDAKSKPITLVAGRRYRIEALHVQPGGSSGLTVRWLRPGANADEIIPAAVLTTESSAPKSSGEARNNGAAPANP